MKLLSGLLLGLFAVSSHVSLADHYHGGFPIKRIENRIFGQSKCAEDIEDASRDLVRAARNFQKDVEDSKWDDRRLLREIRNLVKEARELENKAEDERRCRSLKRMFDDVEEAYEDLKDEAQDTIRDIRKDCRRDRSKKCRLGRDVRDSFSKLKRKFNDLEDEI